VSKTGFYTFKEETMSKSILLCLILAGSIAAQAGSKIDVRDITGCLSQGDNAKQFVLKGNDGSTWDVKSDKVDLAGHVGHTVTATGVVANATMHNMKEDAKATVDKDSAEHGDLTVTAVKMVSDSCK
jgi:hypothetical protein